MRNYFSVFFIFLIVGFYSCGVSEDEHNKVLSENKKLKLQVADLQNRIDVSTLKANLSVLSKQLNEYQSGIPDEIITSLNLILTEMNTPKLEMVLGNSSGEFISSGKAIQSEYEKFQVAISLEYDSIALLDSKITSLEKDIKRLEKNGVEYKSFYIKRRFDTDVKSGKGIYECVDYERYRKVILIAYEDEVESNGFVNIKDLTVKFLGERPTTVTTTTMYNTNQGIEYYKCYETVEKVENPMIVRESLKKIIIHRDQKQKVLDTSSKLYLIDLENSVIYYRTKILEIINGKWT